MTKREWMTMMAAALLAPLAGLALASLLVPAAASAALLAGIALGVVNAAIALLALRLGLGRGERAFWHFAVGLNGLRALGVAALLAAAASVVPAQFPAFALCTLGAVWAFLIAELWCLQRQGTRQLTPGGILQHV